tara:strand:- start:878 stop:1288 length:411 start_codon:yes stop_codon:yes gene_type:complete
MDFSTTPRGTSLVMTVPLHGGLSSALPTGKALSVHTLIGDQRGGFQPRFRRSFFGFCGLTDLGSALTDLEGDGVDAPNDVVDLNDFTEFVNFGFGTFARVELTTLEPADVVSFLAMEIFSNSSVKALSRSIMGSPF